MLIIYISTTKCTFVTNHHRKAALHLKPPGHMDHPDIHISMISVNMHDTRALHNFWKLLDQLGQWQTLRL